jgi:membrane protease YdiL (CAAX protease family)
VGQGGLSDRHGSKPEENLGLALLLSGILAGSLLPFRWAVIEDAGWPKAGLGVVVGFTYNLFQAGFPEEFFYRAYLQGHLAVVFRSRLTSLLLASLIFGLLHILGRLEQGIATAFAFSMLNETVRGLLYGVVWERTRSLIVPTVLHAMENSMLGLRFFVERVLG